MTMRALRRSEVEASAEWIASVQLGSGMIPWYPGGHADAWNHTEAAMALSLAGRRAEAEAAFGWLRDTQQADGSWCLYLLAEGVEDPRRDPNVCAYVATGVWWHWRLSGDRGFLETMWPTVSAAVDFALRLQAPGGEIHWSLDVDGHLGRFALLTGTSSILRSVRLAIALAAALGEERPAWEAAADRIAGAIARHLGAPVSAGVFAPKNRWAMDWYYPVLSGAMDAESARMRLEERWETFVLPGRGVRCVSDHEWITVAETAECAMALDAIGARRRAIEVLGWTRQHRDADGAYATGCVYPQAVRFPGGERSTYSAAAVLMADHLLFAGSAVGDLFRSVGASDYDSDSDADSDSEEETEVA